MTAPAGRRRSTRALRDVSTRAMLSAVPDHMFLMTRDGLYVDYDARDRRKLFVPPKEFLGKNIQDILPRKVAAEFVSAFARVTPSGTPINVVYTLPDATQVRHFEARMTAVGDDEIVMIVRDVTDQKQVEAALRRSERELRQSHRRIRQLAGRLIAAQEHERSRVARELHDDLSQKLAILSIGLNQLALDSEPVERERTSIRGLITQAAELASAVHRLAYALHPSTVATLGVVKAVQQDLRGVRRDTRVHDRILVRRDRPRHVAGGRSLRLPGGTGRSAQRREAQWRDPDIGPPLEGRSISARGRRRRRSGIQRQRRRAARAGARQHARARRRARWALRGACIGEAAALASPSSFRFRGHHAASGCARAGTMSRRRSRRACALLRSMAMVTTNNTCASVLTQMPSGSGRCASSSRP